MTTGDMGYVQQVIYKMEAVQAAANQARSLSIDLKCTVRNKSGQVLGTIEQAPSKGFVFFPAAAEFEGYIAPQELEADDDG